MILWRSFEMSSGNRLICLPDFLLTYQPDHSLIHVPASSNVCSLTSMCFEMKRSESNSAWDFVPGQDTRQTNFPWPRSITFQTFISETPWSLWNFGPFFNVCYSRHYPTDFPTSRCWPCCCELIGNLLIGTPFTVLTLFNGLLFLPQTTQRHDQKKGIREKEHFDWLILRPKPCKEMQQRAIRRLRAAFWKSIVYLWETILALRGEWGRASFIESLEEKLVELKGGSNCSMLESSCHVIIGL